jgi:hypothetical protein
MTCSNERKHGDMKKHIVVYSSGTNLDTWYSKLKKEKGNQEDDI